MVKGDRDETLGKEVVDRVEAEIAACLRRRSSHEARLAGALRMLVFYSARLRDAAVNAAALLVRRESFSRALYQASIRSLAEHGDKRAAPLLAKAMESDEGGELVTLSAACFVKDPVLAAPLARLAASRQAHLAFAAEIARMARGETDGVHLAAIAPKIKESHRIALCVEMFVPLVRGAVLPPSVGPTLAVLRDEERHLGRWLVLAEVAAQASDPTPLQEALAKAKNGPTSARSAWSLVAWALTRSAPLPSVRPTVELIARLSDRPSADRDTTFLFRLAALRSPSIRPMLESLVKTLPLADEVAVRAALYLVRDHGRADLKQALETATRNTKRDEIRGIAVAALWDAGERELAGALAQQVLASRSLSSAAWAGLVKIAKAENLAAPIVTEAAFRWTQWGWLE